MAGLVIHIAACRPQVVLSFSVIGLVGLAVRWPQVELAFSLIGLVGQLAARWPQVALPWRLPYPLVNGLMDTDEWCGRSACSPTAASCPPPQVFTDWLIALSGFGH